MLATYEPPDPETIIASACISDAARNVARAAFTTDPDRSAVSGPNNVAMRAPNPKTRLADEPESRTLEHAQWLRLVWDPACLFSVSQPSPRVILTCDRCKRRHSWLSTPDFFALYPDRAGWIETRTEKRIARIVGKHPGFYVPGAEPGEYECPSGSAFAAKSGLFYLVRTPRAFPPIETRNIRTLLTAWRAPDPDVAASLSSFVARRPGITIDGLRLGGFAVADVMWLIAMGRLCVDIKRHVLADTKRCPVYPDATTAFVHEHGERTSFAIGNGLPQSISFEPGARIRVGDVVFEIAMPSRDRVVLRNIATDRLEPYPRADLERLARDGIAVSHPSGDDVPDPTAALRARIYDTTRDAGLDEAVDRARHLRLAPGLPDGRAKAPSARTLRRWRRRQRQLLALTRDPMVGLIRQSRSGGGRQLDKRVAVMLEAAIDEFYLVPNPKSTADIRAIVEARLTERGLGVLAPAERTVARRIARRSRHLAALAQRGRRGANGLAAYRPIAPDDTPVHGDQPWQIAHADSTQLDIESVCPFTGKGLGRPYATALIDAYSGKCLVDMLHYAAPSAATILRLLRRCIELYGRLPEAIVLDQGPEFFSAALQRFCAWAGVTIIYRPTAQPRFGAPVERHMLEIARIMKRLSGQTTARKDPRSLSPEMDPALFARWDIASLQRLLDDAFREQDKLVRQRSGESPDERFERGIIEHGVVARRVFDPRDPALLAWTLPLVPDSEGLRTISVTGQLSVNYLTYWHPDLERPELAGLKVEVRWDPENMHHIYAFVRGQWLECESRELANVRVVSWPEWQAFSEAIVARNRQTRRTRLVSGAAVAALILSGEATEVQLLARLQAQAEQAAPIQDRTDDAPPSAGAVPRAPRPPQAPDGQTAAVVDDLLAEGERAVDERYFNRAS